MASVELENIVKRYGGVEVIKGLNLSVADGSFTALLGPSGCGKSTLLRMVAGLEEISAGRCTIGTRDVTHEAPAKRGVAMVFQSYALYPHLTVEQNICFSMSLAGESKALQRERAATVAKMLQLEPLLDRRPAQLSGGQRQRVAIGRALVRNPEVFLFDEPLSNLDALLRVQMRLELAKLHSELKTTMIYVTHDQVEAMTLADKIVVLDKGVISQAGTPHELYNNPANRFVAGFIGSPGMNFLKGRSEAREGKTIVTLASGAKVALPGRGALADGQPVELGIRPDHLRVVAPDKGHIAARATVVEYLGNMSHAFFDSPEGPIVLELPKDAIFNAGDAVGLSIETDKAHLFGEDGRAINPV